MRPNNIKTIKQGNFFGPDVEIKVGVWDHKKHRDKYKVPGPAIISFSGVGLLPIFSITSLYHVIDAYGGKLPDDSELRRLGPHSAMAGV